MNRFATIIFLLTTTATTLYVALACPYLMTCHHMKCLFYGAVMPILILLVFGALTYCSRQTIFTSRRWFWTISFVVAVAVWIFVFGGSRVTSVESWKVESYGNYVARTPVNESFYLWQRPWLVHRFYVEMFRSCDSGMGIFTAFWGLLLPVMGVLSIWKIWLLSRRHHSS